MSGRKKILVFIDWFSPGYRAGGPVQSMVNMIAHLKDEFDFFVVTRDTDYCETQPYPGIRPDTWNTLADGTRVFYFSKQGLSRRKMAELIASEPFDYYYVNGIYSRWFSITPLQLLGRARRQGRVLVAVRGMLAGTAIAIKSGKKKLFLLAAQAAGLYRGIIFHATAPQEVQDIRRVFGERVAIRLAGNLPRKPGALPVRPPKEKGKLRMVSIARIAPEKNTLYAIRLLQRTDVAVSADFYGPEYDAAYTAECRTAAAAVPAGVTVRFLPAVPSEKIFSTLSQYDVLLLPTRGENFGHIILEALSCGLPVLISDRTPWSEAAGSRVLPLEEEGKWLDAIREYAAMDEAAYASCSARALAFASAYLGDPAVVDATRALFA